MALEPQTEVDPRIERTRRVVLDAAAELVAETGFDNITIEGVSERCGVARSTIYRHWPGKSELLVDAVRQRVPGHQEIDTGSLRSDVLAFIQDLVAWFESRDGATMVLHLLTVAHRDPSFGKMHGEATRTRRDHLARLISRGVERGELPDDVDLQEAANDLVGVFFYKKMVVHEQVDAEYAVARVDRWLTQVGYRPGNP